MIRLLFFQFILIALAINGCARIDPQIRKSNAQKFALSSGFETGFSSISQFDIWMATRFEQQKFREVIVYIEGDGLAFRRRNQPTNDPTPVDYFTLRLAAQDPAAMVLYLGRPCQYVTPEKLTKCQQKYWTSHRYSEEVIKAYEIILNIIQQQTEFTQLTLIGYSGGGAIAALLAARRSDVYQLITVAANLDLESWTSHHDLPPMKASLNPADFTKDVSQISQLHFVGANDGVVPPTVIESFVKKIDHPINTQLVVVPGYDHQCCWVDDWQELLIKSR